MAELLEQTDKESSTDTELVAAVRRVLQNSPEPMTLAKIKAALPAAVRPGSIETLQETILKQVEANVLIQYPKYRSPGERFWDRPMEVHLAYLVSSALQEKALAWPQIRRKLPDYAKTLAEPILADMAAKGELYQYPRAGSRGGQRFGVEPPSPKDCLRRELTNMFARLTKQGFTHSQLQESALELLHEEEWSLPPAETEKPMASEPAAEAAMPTTTPSASATPENISYTVPAEENVCSSTINPPAGEPHVSSGTAPESCEMASPQAENLPNQESNM